MTTQNGRASRVHHRCSARRFALVAALAIAASHGCAPAPGEGDGAPRAFAPVFIVAEAGLAPPPVSSARARTPDVLLPIDPQSPGGPRFASFALTVSAGDPDRLRVRIVDSARDATRPISRITPPTDRAPIDHADALSDELRASLAAGNGHYWFVGDDAPGAVGRGRPTHLGRGRQTHLGRGRPTHFGVRSATRARGEVRLAVVLPESLLSPTTALELFTSTAADDTAIGAARIEIVPGFFHMVVLGDSVAWGNGLDNRHKYSTLVMNEIEAALGLKVIRQVRAHSGARIIPFENDAVCELNCSGEVPRVGTSITLQAETMKRPDLIDLVLMDGCINDVGITEIFFFPTDDASLAERTDHFCREEMTGLIRRVREIVPNAAIVVTGYYPVVTEASDIAGLREWADARGESSEEQAAAYKNRLVASSDIFEVVAHDGLRRAVDAARQAARPDDPPISLVLPPFGERNAVFAPDRWLWSLTAENELADALNLGITLFPEDEALPLRLELCDGQGDVNRLIFCLYASVAHPNVEGARVFADAIIDELRTIGTLPGN